MNAISGFAGFFARGSWALRAASRAISTWRFTALRQVRRWLQSWRHYCRTVESEWHLSRWHEYRACVSGVERSADVRMTWQGWGPRGDIGRSLPSILPASAQILGQISPALQAPFLVFRFRPACLSIRWKKRVISNSATLMPLARESACAATLAFVGGTRRVEPARRHLSKLHRCDLSRAGDYIEIARRRHRIHRRPNRFLAQGRTREERIDISDDIGPVFPH